MGQHVRAPATKPATWAHMLEETTDDPRLSSELPCALCVMSAAPFSTFGLLSLSLSHIHFFIFEMVWNSLCRPKTISFASQVLGLEPWAAMKCFLKEVVLSFW